MNAIVPAPMAFGDIEKLAGAIAKSKLFGVQTTDQALALMFIAQAEGRHPALAARDYDIIQGRPAKKAEAMLRDFISLGGKVQWHVLTDDLADATFSHPQGGTIRISWDKARAQTAGLAGKDMWKKFPRQMMRSRVVSEGVRTIYPSATSGMYVPEEINDMPEDFKGTTIEADPAPPESIAIRAQRKMMDDFDRGEARRKKEEEEQDASSSSEPAKPKRMTIRVWLDAFEAECRNVTNEEQANALLDRPDVVEVASKLPEAAMARYDSVKAEMLSRIYTTPPDDYGEQGDELPLTDGEKQAADLAIARAGA